MTKLEFKQIEKADIEVVKELIGKCGPYVVPHPDYNYWMLSEYSAEYTLLAIHNGKAVGFVSGFPIHGKPYEMFVIQICVDPEMRGAQVASRMLEELYRRHNQGGRFAIECTISPTNDASRKTFAKLAANHGGTATWTDRVFEGTIVERGFRVEI